MRHIKNKFNLSPESQNKIIKAAVILALVIVFFSFLSRNFSNRGQTLSQYAKENPELAYGSSSEPDDSTVSENLTGKEEAEAPDTGTADISSSDSDSLAEAANPDRITYEQGFYYEPLSEELKTFITGISYPAEETDEISYEDLAYVHVLHYNFDGESTEGELICNKAISQDLVEIFYDLYTAEYQIEKITLIENYDGDDTASMTDNNTSCFNYRTVDGTDRLSRHALGLAIDINPFYNPYIRYAKDGSLIISPQGSEDYADRTLGFPYKIDETDLCYRLFIEHGFTWGGNWNSSKDYQHFQKALP